MHQLSADWPKKFQQQILEQQLKQTVISQVKAKKIPSTPPTSKLITQLNNINVLRTPTLTRQEAKVKQLPSQRIDSIVRPALSTRSIVSLRDMQTQQPRQESLTRLTQRQQPRMQAL